MRKRIGGELPFKSLNENIYFTDSGRSSLRLFIRSGNKDKKYLIPDLFCSVIEDILKQEEVSYDFYKINEDLSINKNTVLNKEYDIFYSINYFGQLQKVDNLGLENKIVIEDNVFFYNFKNNNKFKKWFSFNSFRKITPFADGSLIKTNMNINKSLIDNKESEYFSNKYVAKNLKYKFLNNEKDILEKDYLKIFEEAEEVLNCQKTIYSISNKTMYYLANYNFQEFSEISRKNFEYLRENLHIFWLNKSLIEYNFFTINVENRDSLRKYLFSKNIFLPIHWTNHFEHNLLERSIISIPMFSSYNLEDMEFIIKNIRNFYGIN